VRVSNSRQGGNGCVCEGFERGRSQDEGERFGRGMSWGWG
jgi:hypothetical protein